MHYYWLASFYLNCLKAVLKTGMYTSIKLHTLTTVSTLRQYYFDYLLIKIH